MRKNPAIPTVVKPLIPYIVVGGIVYFFWDKILFAIAGRVGGVPSAAALKADIATIKSGSVKELGNYIGGALLSSVGLGNPIGAASQHAVAQIKTAVSKGWVTLAELPYPAASTDEHLTANKEYISRKLTAGRKK